MTFDEALESVDQLVDKTGEAVDPGVRHAVAVLHMHGIATFASCEGHMDHGYPYPWIDIGQWVDAPDHETRAVAVNQSHVARMAKILEQYYRKHSEIDRTDRFSLEPGGTMGDARLQPACATALEALSEPEKARSLTSSQKALRALTNYLIAQTN